MASWLVRSSPDRAVSIRALAGDSLLCSWAWHFTLSVSLSTQVYKWVLANLKNPSQPPPFSMPSKLLILHGEVKSECFTIGCVPEGTFNYL